MIGFLSLIVFAAALLGLAYLVRGRSPGLGLAAGAAGVVGLMGLAFAFAILRLGNAKFAAGRA